MMSFQVVLIIHVILALGLVSIILLQHGKGADAGAAFGSGAAGAVFGARGAHSFLYKLTSGLAIGFFITSIFLAYLSTSETTISSSNQQSIMSEVITFESGLPTTSTSDIPSN